MGITSRSNMVLLSTLAALVIIVHSAEEEYENQYRRGLRQRASDTGTRRFEQPWRTLEVEPVMEQSTSRSESEDTSSEEPPKRRRLGRKRKRRPEPTYAEEFAAEGFAFTEDQPRPRFDEFINERTSEMPKRRKKHERKNKWADSLEEDRPIRRRGQRRKRPTIDTWVDPEISEFDDYQSHQASRYIDEVTTDQTTTINQGDHIEDIGGVNYHSHIVQSEDRLESREDMFEIDNRHKNPSYNKKTESIYRALENEDGYRINTPEKKLDPKSEFSLEDLEAMTELNTNKKQKTQANIMNKSSYKENMKTRLERGKLHFTEIEKSQEKLLNRLQIHPCPRVPTLAEYFNSSGYGKEQCEENDVRKHKLKQEHQKDYEHVRDPIDPLTLKDILKKSNGTSLSEILQQHNLSLTDLLHGKELALSILKSENTVKIEPSSLPDILKENNLSSKPNNVSSEEKESNEDKLFINSETKYVTEPIIEIPATTLTTQNDDNDDITTVVDNLTATSEQPYKEEPAKQPNIRRYPAGIRRKQRLRPVINNNFKSQINRDMLAMTARKYFYNNNRRRNATKSQEWRDVIPLMKNVTEIISEKPKVETTTLSDDTEITTVIEENDDNRTTTVFINNTTQKNSIDIQSDIAVSQNDTKVARSGNLPKPVLEDKDLHRTIPSLPQDANTSGLRRQAFNNILKKKRRKHKYSTTEPPPQDDFMKNLLGMPNLVSSSEFIARTQSSKTRIDDVTILEDFITTEMPSIEDKLIEDKPKTFEDKPRKSENRQRISRYSTRSPTTYIYRQTFIPSSTEESAKIEIEEILNDSGENARLSKILLERNMTLNELVEHRERGSSHVHLADIFHNASKEPSPPEPFLSKSAIEPISKETYPLRALLDAHDTTTKLTTIDPVQDDFIHIPMKMDFGNNVNENAENMGIMSLFHNITKTAPKTNASSLMKDSHGTPYKASVIVVNATDKHNQSDTVRESRLMHPTNENPEDIVGWNQIFSLMRRNYENKTKELSGTYLDGLIPAESIRKPSFDEDLDGDGLIVLEDLQRLNELSSKITSGESLDLNPIEAKEAQMNKPGIDKGNNLFTVKSITLAAASIVGIALVLFLLTFIAYRWRQQRNLVDRNFPDERIPSPVFENRKGHKNNSSTRSISPMLTSNIYTLSTLDSQNGKESPDYMWDSLRKPFQ